MLLYFVRCGLQRKNTFSLHYVSVYEWAQGLVGVFPIQEGKPAWVAHRDQRNRTHGQKGNGYFCWGNYRSIHFRALSNYQRTNCDTPICTLQKYRISSIFWNGWIAERQGQEALWICHNEGPSSFITQGTFNLLRLQCVNFNGWVSLFLIRKFKK